MTMVPRPLTNTPHEAWDNPVGAPLREPKVAQPNHDASVFRPRWTSVRDEFERCGVLPPPPPEPFLGDLNVNNAEISSNRVTSRPIPINNSGQVTRAKEVSLSATPILRDNHNHNVHGTSSVAPVNGYHPANSNLAMHAQNPPPETSLPGISALGDLNVNNTKITSNRVTSRPIPINNSGKVTRAKEDSLGASPILRDIHSHNAHGTFSVPPVKGYRPANSNLAMHTQNPPPETSLPGISTLGAIPKSARNLAPVLSTQPSRKFQPLRRPAPSIKISHYCHTCKQDVGTINANMTCPLCFGTFLERSETVERADENLAPTSDSTWWPPQDPAELTMQKQLDDVAKKTYYCYECKSTVRFFNSTIWEMVNLRCPKCNSTFIEEQTTALPWIDKEEAETVERSEVPWNGKEEAETITRNDGKMDETLALLAAQPVGPGEEAGFAWVPPERNMQAFLSAEDKFKLWEVNNKFLALEDADRVEKEFPELPPPSLPAYGTVKPRAMKQRSLSCGTNVVSADDDDDDDDDDAWEQVDNGRHPNRGSRLEKRR